jgi:hypothetical protein
MNEVVDQGMIDRWMEDLNTPGRVLSLQERMAVALAAAYEARGREIEELNRHLGALGVGVTELKRKERRATLREIAAWAREQPPIDLGSGVKHHWGSGAALHCEALAADGEKNAAVAPDICSDCGAHASLEYITEDLLYGVEPNTVTVKVDAVPVYHCGCGFQWTDYRADEVRDAAIARHRETLAACPFCGGEAICTPDDVGSGGQHVAPYHAGCPRCRIFMTKATSCDARAAWNRRMRWSREEKADT